MNKWNVRFFELSEHVSKWSKDKSTKVGAIIVNENDLNPISIGYNGFPKGINDDIEERHDRKLKYEFTVHAEANAIVNAAKNGQKTKNCSIYVNYFPCANCSGLIVNSGITKVVCKNKPNFNDERWGDKWKISYDILNEANVEILFLNEN